MPVRMPWNQEPRYTDYDKPLIINVAPGQSLTFRDQNPNLPYSPEEIAAQVIAAYQEGASIWHVHPRHPTEGHQIITDEERIRLHLETARLVLDKCPDIITDPGEGNPPPAEWDGYFVKPESIGPEAKHALWYQPLLDHMNGNPRLSEINVVNCHTFVSMGAVIVETPESWQAQVKWLQERGIKPELAAYNHTSLYEIKEHLIETGIAKPPYFIDLCLGVHNTNNIIPTSEGIDHLDRMIRSLPENAVTQGICGGRNQFAMTCACILYNLDCVRVGMEEGIYRYPHKDDLIENCAQMVKAAVDFAKLIGRPIATPAQAREIIGLKPL